MKEVTPAITEIKTRVSLDEWKQRILDFQNSGKGIIMRRSCSFGRSAVRKRIGLNLG